MVTYLEKWLEKLPYLLRMLLAVLLLAVLTGLGGILLHVILDFVETLAFGHSEDSFPFFTDHTTWQDRLLSLLVVGILSAVVWYVLQKKATILSIKAEMKTKSPQLYSPRYLWHQMLHIIWQIVAVGAGAPVGKESAPRELGALLAGPISHRSRLDLTDRAFLIACGAGAGLAAVYQVPLTSVIFVIETLRVKVSLRNILLLILATYLSAFVARLTISTAPLYKVASFQGDISLLGPTLVIIGVLVPLALVFATATKWVTSRRVKNRRILLSLPLSFGLVGLLAVDWPYLLGNGRMMAQSILDGVDMRTALILFALKALVVLVTLWAGTYGGTLTPSFALGIAGASVLLALFPSVLGGVSASSLFLIGAVTFLTVTLNAPLSATGLVIGFTGQEIAAIPFLLLTALLAFACSHGIKRLLAMITSKIIKE